MMISILSLLFALIASVSPSISLTVSHPTVKSSEQLEFTVVVKGPYEGGVCLLASTEDEHTFVGSICPSTWSDIDVDKDSSLTLPLSFSGPGVGTFHIFAVLVDSDAPRIHSVGVPVVVE